MWASCFNMKLTQVQYRRFAAKFVIDHNSGCWIWISSQSAGYGTFWLNGKPRMAHIVSYLHFVGLIPNGVIVHHTCKLTCCVNPAHLKLRTRIEHGQEHKGDFFNDIKTHCPQGHLYNEENTYIYPATKWRGCKECNRERARQNYRNKNSKFNGLLSLEVPNDDC